MTEKTVQGHVWTKFNKWFATCLSAKDGGGPNWVSIQRGWSYEGLMGAPGFSDDFRHCPWIPVRDGQQFMLDF
eukprot:6867383-Prorocentrum_lima.AAC.1